MITLGLLESNIPVERPIRRASWCLERRGETEREREAREEDDSSKEDWAERIARAAVRRWAGEHNFINRGSSHCAKPGRGREGRADLIKIIITLKEKKKKKKSGLDSLNINLTGRFSRFLCTLLSLFGACWSCDALWWPKRQIHFSNTNTSL